MNAPFMLGAGLHAKLAMADYLALPYLSSGLCNRLLSHSPYHAKHELEHREQDDTEASDNGTAIHDALLEGVDRIESIRPEDYRSKPTKANPDGAIPKGWTNNAIKAARDAARAEGRIPMLAGEVANIVGAVESARRFIEGTTFAGIFDRGQPELTIVWTEGAGVLCKMRPDWLTDERDALLHVKTTKGGAGPQQFARTVDSMGYDVALAFYERGLATISDRQAHHVILAIEQDPPYGCALYDLDPAKQAIAASKVERAIATWKQCVARGNWPCYASHVHSLEPTPWQLGAEEREQHVAFTLEQMSAGIPL